MSLLRSVLKKSGVPSSNQADAPFNPNKAISTSKSSRSSAQSFKSVASTIKSIASFYSVLTGNGAKIAKRRRPPILTFGAPTFYHSDPPPAVPVEGVERVPPEQTSDLPFTAAHAKSLLDEKKDAWLSIVVFNHSRPPNSQPLYYDQASVSGQVRLRLTKPRNIESIEVWVSKMPPVNGIDFNQNV